MQALRFQRFRTNRLHWRWCWNTNHNLILFRSWIDFVMIWLLEWPSKWWTNGKSFSKSIYLFSKSCHRSVVFFTEIFTWFTQQIFCIFQVAYLLVHSRAMESCSSRFERNCWAMFPTNGSAKKKRKYFGDPNTCYNWALLLLKNCFYHPSGDTVHTRVLILQLETTLKLWGVHVIGFQQPD